MKAASSADTILSNNGKNCSGSAADGTHVAGGKKPSTATHHNVREKLLRNLQKVAECRLSILASNPQRLKDPDSRAKSEFRVFYKCS